MQRNFLLKCYLSSSTGSSQSVVLLLRCQVWRTNWKVWDGLTLLLGLGVKASFLVYNPIKSQVWTIAPGLEDHKAIKFLPLFPPISKPWRLQDLQPWSPPIFRPCKIQLSNLIVTNTQDYKTTNLSFISTNSRPWWLPTIIAIKLQTLKTNNHTNIQAFKTANLDC